MMHIATRGGFAACLRLFTYLGILAAWDQPVYAGLQASATKGRRAADVESSVPSSEPTTTEFAQGFQRSRSARQPGARIYKDKITPHWFAGNARFWYRNDLRGGGREFVVVDAERGRRSPAFDHDKLADALSKATDTKYPADRLPFDSIEFVDDAKAIQFRVSDAVWNCDLKSYECAKIDAKTTRREPEAGGQRPVREEPSRQGQERRGPNRSPISPDGKWTAIVQDHNVFVRARGL